MRGTRGKRRGMVGTMMGERSIQGEEMEKGRDEGPI
jgi:hypothetical protein